MARKPSSDSVSHSMEYGINLATRSIHVAGEIDDMSVSRAVRGLELLCSASLAPVTIYLSSGGGDVEVGWSLYDSIELSPSEVTVVALGSCQSMAAIILQAADIRVVSPRTTIMLHNPSIQADYESRSFRNWAEWAKDMETSFADILAQRSGKKASFWKNRLKSDAVFSAQQAVDAGLADRILTSFPWEADNE